MIFRTKLCEQTQTHWTQEHLFGIKTSTMGCCKCCSKVKQTAQSKKLFLGFIILSIVVILWVASSELTKVITLWFSIIIGQITNSVKPVFHKAESLAQTPNSTWNFLLGMRRVCVHNIFLFVHAQKKFRLMENRLETLLQNVNFLASNVITPDRKVCLVPPISLPHTLHFSRSSSHKIVVKFLLIVRH